VNYQEGDGGYNHNPPSEGSTDGMTPYEVGSHGTADDTLWEIAERELGSGHRWNEIRQADGTTYTRDESRRISEGTTVYLPSENGGGYQPPEDGSQDSGDDEQPGDEEGNEPTPMTPLEKALDFIEKIESKHNDKSNVDISQILRAHTGRYVDLKWDLATGYFKDKQGEELNLDVTLSNQSTDFGHLIASLSNYLSSKKALRDQKVPSSFTSWAGDIGSAVVKSRNENITMEKALQAKASDQDYSADILANAIGLMLTSNNDMSIADVIRGFDKIPYEEIVRFFTTSFLGGKYEYGTLSNRNEVDWKIRAEVRNYLGWRLKLPWGADIAQGSEHFLDYLEQHSTKAKKGFPPPRDEDDPVLV
jgi:hypothetical protein